MAGGVRSSSDFVHGDPEREYHRNADEVIPDGPERIATWTMDPRLRRRREAALRRAENPGILRCRAVGQCGVPQLSRRILANLVKLKARLDAGPTAEDRVCTLRGRDIRHIAKDELGTEVSLTRWAPHRLRLPLPHAGNWTVIGISWYYDTIRNGGGAPDGTVTFPC